MNQHISIPKPCHEDWNKMNPNNEGKFCSSCSKTVVDFTKMSKEEIHSYFKQKSGEQTCGHFYASQLHENIKPRPSVFKRVNYFATIVFGLFLPLSSCKKQVTGEPAVSDKDSVSISRTTVGVILVHPDSLKQETVKGEAKHLQEHDTLVDGNVEIKDK